MQQRKEALGNAESGRRDEEEDEESSSLDPDTD